MATTIRLATAADTQALARLRRAWIDEDGPSDDASFEERFAMWFASEEAHRVFWLAEIDSEPVGMLNLFVFQQMPSPGRPPGRWGYVANTYVAREHRDRGTGRLLLDAAIAYAREHRFIRVVLHPSARSVPYYERAGFAPATSLLMLEL